MECLNCAAMREALTEALELVDINNNCPCYECERDRQIAQCIKKSLSSSAGQDMLERVRKLEAVAEAITDEDRLREFVDRVTRYPAEPPLNLLRQCFPEIEALEGGEQA